MDGAGGHKETHGIFFISVLVFRLNHVNIRLNNGGGPFGGAPFGFAFLLFVCFFLRSGASSYRAALQVKRKDGGAWRREKRGREETEDKDDLATSHYGHRQARRPSRPFLFFSIFFVFVFVVVENV